MMVPAPEQDSLLCSSSWAGVLDIHKYWLLFLFVKLASCFFFHQVLLWYLHLLISSALSSYRNNWTFCVRSVKSSYCPSSCFSFVELYHFSDWIDYLFIRWYFCRTTTLVWVNGSKRNRGRCPFGINKNIWVVKLSKLRHLFPSLFHFIVSHS